MTRRKRSLAERLASSLGEAERVSDLDEARRVLEGCLASIGEHPYSWLVDYDVPERGKKKFYRSLSRDFTYPLRRDLRMADYSRRIPLSIARTEFKNVTDETLDMALELINQSIDEWYNR